MAIQLSRFRVKNLYDHQYIVTMNVRKYFKIFFFFYIFDFGMNVNSQWKTTLTVFKIVNKYFHPALLNFFITVVEKSI